MEHYNFVLKLALTGSYDGEVITAYYLYRKTRAGRSVPL